MSVILGIYAAYLGYKQDKRKPILIQTSNGDAKILKMLPIIVALIAIFSSIGGIILKNQLDESRNEIVYLHEGLTDLRYDFDLQSTRMTMLEQYGTPALMDGSGRTDIAEPSQPREVEIESKTINATENATIEAAKEIAK